MNKAIKYSSFSQLQSSNFVPDSEPVLNVAHKFEEPTDLEQLAASRLTVEDKENIKRRLINGEHPKVLAEEFAVSDITIYGIGYDSNIDFQDARPYTDIELVYGFKGQHANKRGGSLPVFDEYTKANFSYLLQRHENIIEWAINTYMAYCNDRDEMRQVIRIMLYYRYSKYNPNKGSFVSWMSFTCKYIILRYIERRAEFIKNFKDSDKVTKRIGSKTYSVDIENISEEETDAAYLEEHVEGLYRAIADLPAKAQEIAKLYLEGYSVEAIAVRTKTGVDYVKVYIGEIRYSIAVHRDKYFPNLSRFDEAKILAKSYRDLYAVKRTDGIQLPKDKIKHIVELLKTTPVRVVTTMVGLSEPTVYKIVKAYGITPVRKQNKRSTLAPEKDAQVRELLQSLDYSARQIHQMTGVSEPTIIKIRKEMGLLAEGSGRRLSDAKKAEILELLSTTTLSNKEIARKYKCSDVMVGVLAKKNGLRQDSLFKSKVCKSQRRASRTQPSLF